MTYIDRDLGPDGPTRAPAKPVTTQRTQSGGQPPLLDLQRLAGNAAVSSAIRDGRFDPSVPVQRIQADEDEDVEGYANESEEADAAAQQTEAAEDAKAYGEADEASGPQGYANDEEEADEAEDEAETAEEAKAYGETETDESEEEAKEG